MSEPHSFFLRATISPERLQAFLQAAPRNAELTAAWLQWWNSREKYGDQPLTASDLRAYRCETNQSILEMWRKDVRTGTVVSYDEPTQCWQVGIVMASENYLEILPLLVFAQQVQDEKLPSEDDFALIYPFFWGDSNVMAYLDYSAPQAAPQAAVQSTADVPADKLAYADAQLTRMLDMLQQAD